MTTVDALAELLRVWTELSSWDTAKLTEYIDASANQPHHDIQRRYALAILANRQEDR